MNFRPQSQKIPSQSVSKNPRIFWPTTNPKVACIEYTPFILAKGNNLPCLICVWFWSFRSQIKSATCQDGMQMVHRYLETSKVELIKNIRAAKMIQCSLQSKAPVYTVPFSKKTLRNNTVLAFRLHWNVFLTGGCSPLYSSPCVTHVTGVWKRYETFLCMHLSWYILWCLSRKE